MADIGTMRAAIKARLAAADVPDLLVYEHWPNVLNAPKGGCAAIIKPSSGLHDQSFGSYPSDRTEMMWELHLFVSTDGGIPNAEDILDRYLSNSGVHSIRLAVAGDRRFGAEVDYTQIVGWRDYDLKQWPDDKVYAGAVIDLRCDLR